MTEPERIEKGPLHIDQVLAVLPPGESVEVHYFLAADCPVCKAALN